MVCVSSLYGGGKGSINEAERTREDFYKEVLMTSSSSPSALRRKLRKILDENASNESVRDAGLHSLANALEENECMRMEIGGCR